MINIIIATDISGGFGYKGQIPWFNEPFMKADRVWFQKATKGKLCVMGRTTAQEIAVMNSKRKNPPTSLLEGRECIVISSDPKLKIEGATISNSLSMVLYDHKDEDMWILGGYRMFLEALPFAANICVTLLKEQHEYVTDRQFPIKYLNDKFKIHSGEETDDLYFLQYRRK